MMETARALVERVMFFQDGNKTFFDPEAFLWVAPVEAEWKLIRTELESLLMYREEIPNFQDISEAQKALTEGEQWKTFWFCAYGEKAEENCARCPETVRILQQIPGMKSAMFSILAPKKHVPEHRGLWKGVLRYHLGLIVPEPKGSSRIRVGKDVRYWEEGKSMVFDDSHPHEVWNDSSSHRVVLFVDVVRPLFFPLSLLNRAIIWIIARSPSVAEPMGRVRKYGREGKKAAEARDTRAA
ncbi:MAG: aspartyl/asparaginyl beta-hydroxylase domain-containing protein [Candidatus Sulfotelmatobacter sp.]